MGEQFAVRVYYDNGEDKDVRRFVSAQEASRAFQHYTSSAGADGSTVRVIVIDRNDRIVREWKLGQGITFPPPHSPLHGMPRAQRSPPARYFCWRGGGLQQPSRMALRTYHFSRVATRFERVIGPVMVIDQNQRRLSGPPRVW